MRPKISLHILVFFERTFTLVFSATIDWFITQYTLSLSPSSVEGKSMLHDNSVILMTELWKLEVYPMLISWIAAFLTDRQQAVRTGATLSDWKFLKGGLPQGVKLGVILFIIMTNNLLADGPLRVEFLDDTSAIEILPRNSISLLNSIVSDIHRFSMDHNMQLNLIKCKEMLINFMFYPDFTLRPLVVGNNSIEHVSTNKSIYQ